MAKIRCKFCGEPIKAQPTCDICGNKYDEETVKDYLALEMCRLEYDETIRKKIQTGTPLSTEEDTKFHALLNYEMLEYEDLDDTCIYYCIFNKNKIFSFDTFKQFSMTALEKSMEKIARVFDNKMTDYYIGTFVRDLGNNTLGQYNRILNHYTFDTSTIKNLYDGDLDAFITLNHEMYHGIDEIAIKTDCVSVLLMKIIKDNIISRIPSKYNDVKTRSYYTKNYKHIAGEIHAQQEAVSYTERILEAMGLKPNPDFIEEERNYYDLDYLNQNRIVTIDGEEKIMTVDEIFDDIIADHPELLDEYSQLNLEYVKDGDKVRRKTKKELKETYEALEKTDAKVYMEYVLKKKNIL